MDKSHHFLKQRNSSVDMSKQNLKYSQCAFLHFLTKAATCLFFVMRYSWLHSSYNTNKTSRSPSLVVSDVKRSSVSTDPVTKSFKTSIRFSILSSLLAIFLTFDINAKTTNSTLDFKFRLKYQINDWMMVHKTLYHTLQ